MGSRQLHEFTVEGIGPFPFDMLRYDQCWPKTQEGSAAIVRGTRRGHHGVEKVDLVSLGKPTEARWQSFGWRVVEQAA